ncbi:MAG TPA: Phenylacetic acid catabolic protein, partial [Longimicrobium sp.]|nr:Phenylacetic acid catabolic protein [Longimicrobium sp.]
ERPSAEYRSHPALDAGFGSWADFIACILLVDTSLVVQYGALVESRYTPAHNRVQKMLDEERFHFQYAAGWVRRMAAVPEVREELSASLARYLPQALQWLGDDAGSASKRLVEEGLVSAGPSDLRARFLSRVVPVLADAGLADELGLTRDSGEWRISHPLSFNGWSEETRRAGGALDEETAARARGDKNRALLMD